MSPRSTWVALAAAAACSGLVGAQVNPCVSYGVDFQSGGSYFQNISSTSPFTFVSLFEGKARLLFVLTTLNEAGCQDDVANNILVDPNGDEYQCTDTDLTPPDSDQLSTCPLDKDEMYSGDWPVVIISNNGDAEPIAYERDFYLSVGVPATVTYTPTVTLSSTTTPLVNSTTLVTDLVSTTVNATVTSPSATMKPTTTVTPKKVTVSSTKTMATVSKIHYTVVPKVIVQTHTASCHVPMRQQHPDPKCTFTPTLIKAAALETSASKAHARDVAGRSVPLDREVRIAERKAALAERAVLEKRSPDNATTTVTDTNTVRSRHLDLRHNADMAPGRLLYHDRDFDRRAVDAVHYRYAPLLY